MGHASRAQPRPVAVHCRNVVKDFGTGETRVRALGGVDLKVFAGEMTLLIGPSGCGKTTLISIIAGILPADAGQVDVFGTEITDLSGARATRYRGANVGLILQQFNLFPALTAIENVAVPLLIQGRQKVEATTRAAGLLDEFGLGAQANKYPSELSMGQQQRIAIARALVHEPRLVICDEPTAMLDAASGFAVVKMLRRVTLRPDRAVIVVTHDNRILPFADRTASMSDGRITDLKINMSKRAA